MNFTKRLKWSPIDDFGQTEAKSGPFTFVAWAKAEHGELRFIRRDNVGGIIVPMSDFSIYCRDLNEAKKVAKKLNRIVYKVRKSNPFLSL